MSDQYWFSMSITEIVLLRTFVIYPSPV